MYVTPKGDTEDKSPIYGFINSGGDKKSKKTITVGNNTVYKLSQERGKENDNKILLAHSFSCVGNEYCTKLCAG